ncbi:hypothetical protein TKK_0018727 [Trichogramma kaykai]|uniref:Nucleoside diphosphate kinase n=1 Tax=Trichogramma kaykai TaxID=54128 RepID=A0ABD2VY95_9HYME
MTTKKPFQLTLAILKPHVVKNPFALQNIREMILSNDIKIVRTQRTIISQKLAEKFYEEHKGKFFYNRLTTFMSSGPSDIHILTAPDVIAKWRKLLGPTKCYQTQFSDPNTIRGMFGLSDTRNAGHGSDSEESAAREISVFFSDFKIKDWYENEEIHFETGNLKFDKDLFVHLINKNIVGDSK